VTVAALACVEILIGREWASRSSAHPNRDDFEVEVFERVAAGGAGATTA
jgi:hypothetical protein